MEWHKVEDYPAGSNEYVLVSSEWNNQRFPIDCFVAKKRGNYWVTSDKEYYIGIATDRWCHIDLSEANHG